MVSRARIVVFVPDGFGQSGAGPAIVLFNGSGSSVDGLMDPWKDIARKDGVILIGPDAFRPGAWRIPQDSPDFTGEVVEDVEGEGFRSIRAACISSGIQAAPATCCCSGCSSPSTSRPSERTPARYAQTIDALLDVPQRKIPMAIWVGTKDQMVPLKMVRDTLAVLTARNFPAKTFEMPGHTHSYAERAPEVTAAAWEFLRKESLTADPKFYRYPFK